MSWDILILNFVSKLRTNERFSLIGNSYLNVSRCWCRQDVFMCAIYMSRFFGESEKVFLQKCFEMRKCSIFEVSYIPLYCTFALYLVWKNCSSFCYWKKISVYNETFGLFIDVLFFSRVTANKTNMKIFDSSKLIRFMLIWKDTVSIWIRSRKFITFALPSKKMRFIFLYII